MTAVYYTLTVSIETQLTDAIRRLNRTYYVDRLLQPVLHLYGFAQQIHQSLHAV